MAAEPDPDAARMLRVRDGDVPSFRELVERWLRPLASFFHRLGADPATAEDCSMEVFEKLFRTRASYEPRAKFSTYLFAIARHHWIDWIRHRAIGPPTVSADAPTADGDTGGADRLVGVGAAPSSGAEEGEVHAAIRRAVDALSPEHREVFALSQAGLRYQEISEILKIPVGTVKSRMFTAVAFLRDHLEQAGFEP